MAQDNVSEILSSEARQDLSDLQSGLQNATNELEKFAKVAKGITIDFKGAKDFATLIELQNKVAAATDKMEKAQRNFADEIDRAQVREEAAVNKMLAAQVKRAQREEELLNKMIAAEEKASARAIAAQERKAKKEEEILNRMIAAEEKAAAQKQKLENQSAVASQKAAAEAEKRAAREETALRQLNNEYETLKKSYNTAAAAAKELGIAAEISAQKLGRDSAETKNLSAQYVAATASAKKMYDSLLKVEMAVGQGQRAVGQYNQAAFAMQQILREGPAFANSFGTGIMAISNNIPILVDEIKRMKIANDELRASGAATIPIWKTLLGSIFSPMGLMSVALTGLTFLATKVDIFSEKTDKAKQSADAFAESMKNVARSTGEEADKQMRNAEVLSKIVGDETKSNQVRVAAFKELQDMYPQYLADLKAEDMLKGNAYEKLQLINKEIEARARLQATEEVGIALRRRESELLAEAYNAETLEDQYKARTALQKIGEEIKNNNKLFEEQRQEVLYFPTAKDKEKKTKPTKSSGMVSPTNEAIQSAYDASIQELTITKDKNKLIADDEKRSLEERLQAYNVYNAVVLAILQQQKNKEINNEALKYQEIQAEKKGKSGQELKNLIDQEQAVITRISTIRKKADADTIATTEKAKKDQLAIIYGSNEQWIKSEEFRNEKLKELQIGLFLQDAELLKRQLAAKEITQRQYNDKMKQLRKTEGVMLLDDDIALYEKILANDQITAERRLDIQRKLNNALKAKSQMSEGQPMRKSGRLTDGLAQAMGMTGEAEMQEFYDRSIALANQAADAIIDAKRRQYEAEMGMLDRQKEAIDANYQLQYDYINATTKDETEKANKIAQLQAQKQAQDAEIDGKKREVAKRMAAAEKTAAIASIIQSTAVAIAGALKYGPAAPPIIALIAAAGAVQLASAASAPIPAYAKGTDSHKGGLFFAGDGGEPEYIKAPNKAGYWSASSTTLYNEPKGTTVTPMSKFVDVVGGYKIGGLQKESERKLFEYLGDKFAEHLWQHGENLSHVIMSAQPKQQKQDLSEAVIKLQRLGR
jgi:hypothetical protein